MTPLLKFLAALALLPIVAAFNGFVLQVLWGWFVVATFSAPPLSIVQSIGVMIVIGFLTMNKNLNVAEKPEDERIGLLGTCAVTFVVGLFSLAYGFFFHLFQ